MPELLYLPPWQQQYGFSVQPAVVRSSPGHTQARASHRQTVIANVQRFLRGAELPYFEAFHHNELKDGTLKFTDWFIDENGLQRGLVRIVDGKYTARSSDLIHFTITCRLEIFR